MLIINALLKIQAKTQAKKSVSRPVVSAFLDGNIFLICRARCIREGHRQKPSFG